jgi:hypothetical protein
MRNNNEKVLSEISVGFAVSGLLLNVLVIVTVFQLFRLLQMLFDDSGSALFRGVLLP